MNGACSASVTQDHCEAFDDIVHLRVVLVGSGDIRAAAPASREAEATNQVD